MYWTNFWQPTVNVQQNIFEKTLIKVGSSHLYASFDTFCVQIGQLFVAHWDFKLSEEFEIDAIYIFQRLTMPQKLTDLGAKGAKRSVKMWATNFY